MKKNLIYKVFLVLFAVLYVSTAFISFLHAIEFFSIGNVHWMSLVLSAVFEVGQMTVLMSLLMSENSKKLLPWGLMGIFTSVQVISNVYSVTKFIMLSDVEYYKYLEQALRFLIQGIPQDMILTVIAWIIGGLLPVCALLLTAMCASQIRIMEAKNNEAAQQVLSAPAVESQKEESVQEPSVPEIMEEAPVSVPDEPEHSAQETPADNFDDDFSDVVGETPVKVEEKKPASIINKISSAVEKIKPTSKPAPKPVVKPVQKPTTSAGSKMQHEGPRVASATYFEKPDRP